MVSPLLGQKEQRTRILSLQQRIPRVELEAVTASAPRSTSRNTVTLRENFVTPQWPPADQGRGASPSQLLAIPKIFSAAKCPEVTEKENRSSPCLDHNKRNREEPRACRGSTQRVGDQADSKPAPARHTGKQYPDKFCSSKKPGENQRSAKKAHRASEGRLSSQLKTCTGAPQSICPTSPPAEEEPRLPWRLRCQRISCSLTNTSVSAQG
mmetsp:Transcript_62437/g.129671  ORF Transcript_62437/g.129671 Transcript_62437/m.129671 type:complete len:210 (+) Transcript_62437:108-737(+)